MCGGPPCEQARDNANVAIDSQGHSLHNCPTASRWSPSQEDWEEMAPLSQARSFFPLVVFDGQLYALGGRDNGVALNSVETYNPELNVWR